MFWDISIDTGGTFTDCIAVSPNGDRSHLKLLSSAILKGEFSTIANSSSVQTSAAWLTADIFEGYKLKITGHEYLIQSTSHQTGLITLDRSVDLESGVFDLISPEEVPVFALRIITSAGLVEKLPPLRLRLGTTRGTNALLENKGAKVSLFVTKGFADLLNIGTQQRPHIFSLKIDKRPSLVHEVIEVDERIGADGSILTALDNQKSYEINGNSIAISFLNSYANDKHESQLTEQLSVSGVDHISTSSKVSGRLKYLDRTETTAVNAYLRPILTNYLKEISLHAGEEYFVMTSAGSLTHSRSFAPKDSLLSGPAGGVAGAAAMGLKHDKNRLVSFDMGGTSTDVALFDEGFDYAHTTRVGHASIQAPALNIHTIAAGGGSICTYSNGVLQVGPESGGAWPGPACYGQGGPLTLTDINLLAGRIYPSTFTIPLDITASENALYELSEHAGVDPDTLLNSFLQIANEKMAGAINKISVDRGTSVEGATLVAFGGAGGQHACDLAEVLNMDEIIIPYEAGLLSAYGISQASIGMFGSAEIYKPWSTVESTIKERFESLIEDVRSRLINEGIEGAEVSSMWVFLRLSGQETSLEVPYTGNETLQKFKELYLNIYGHWIPHREIELTSIKVQLATLQETLEDSELNSDGGSGSPINEVKCLSNGRKVLAEVYEWERLQPGTMIQGPALIFSRNCTVFISEGWEGNISPSFAFMLSKQIAVKPTTLVPESAAIQLYLNRFKAIVGEMGAVLERSSFSVNVKERLDFSCALLDSSGELVVNAPHIPVHLGSMGLCVREVLKVVNLVEGDIVITNHPAYGGSHLPDITLIAPVYADGTCIAYVANRAHHAEIGGKTPGSMPPDASELYEEGIIISPQFLMKGNRVDWDEIRKIFEENPYPSRAIDENIADLKAAVASLQAGIRGIQSLCSGWGIKETQAYLSKLTDYVAQRFETFRINLPAKGEAFEQLDDGTKIQVSFTNTDSKIVFDFTGSAKCHPGNYNATAAIVRSVVLYVLRLLMDDDIPLNEGILKKVRIIIPGDSMLNPDFNEHMPAVVGGNTEVSQRLCDTILKAFGIAACSQGTMNNLIFGNANFGFYETIGGGVGAGDGFPGASSVHQHMTNTRITDAEILEMNYPVRLKEFSIRQFSGGAGKWKGGNGILRRIEFLEPVEVSLLTQHRETGPYGLNGGKEGKPGEQWVEHPDGTRTKLGGTDYYKARKGDQVVIKTPGGGGFGR